MRVILLFFLLGIATGCTSSSTEIRVRYVYSGISESVVIPCSFFDSQFENIIREELLGDDAFVSQLLDLTASLEPDTTAIPVDTRIKITIKYSDNRLDELCMGDFFGIVYNGVKQRNQPELFKLLDSKIDRKTGWSGSDYVQ